MGDVCDQFIRVREIYMKSDHSGEIQKTFAETIMATAHVMRAKQKHPVADWDIEIPIEQCGDNKAAYQCASDANQQQRNAFACTRATAHNETAEGGDDCHNDLSRRLKEQ